MQNKKLIILIILGVLAVFSLVRGMVVPTRIGRRVSTETTSVEKGAPIVSAERGITAKRQVKRSDYVTWGRNPFAPKEIPAKAAVTRLTLNGIMWDEESPKAIIGDNVVGIGDKVAGNTVVDIKIDRVVLNDGISNFELTLGP